MQPAEAPERKLLILLPHIDSWIRLQIRARVAMVAAIVRRKQQVKGGGDLVMQTEKNPWKEETRNHSPKGNGGKDGENKEEEECRVAEAKIKGGVSL